MEYDNAMARVSERFAALNVCAEACAEPLEKALDGVVAALKIWVSKITPWLTRLWDFVCDCCGMVGWAVVNRPKWAWYWRYGHNYRTRKKYYDRIRRAYKVQQEAMK